MKRTTITVHPQDFFLRKLLFTITRPGKKSIVNYPGFTRLTVIIFLLTAMRADGQEPQQIQFVRQGVQRMIFDEKQAIPLSVLDPSGIIGLEAMHPVTHYTQQRATIKTDNNRFIVQSTEPVKTSVWLGGFNPFAIYTINLDSLSGQGAFGFEFSDPGKKEQLFFTLEFAGSLLTDLKLTTLKNNLTVEDRSVIIKEAAKATLKGKVFLQLLGSGFTIFLQDKGLPTVIAQGDFNMETDPRSKYRILTYQSNLYFNLQQGLVSLNKASIAFTTGIGLADIRAITYENGEPFMDRDRLWYTMSIRGRALPHHIQGVFSMNPSVFDVRLEGVILFDQGDGLLRNEIASHIFFDRKDNTWRGLTTGFSAFANPAKEKKQLLAVESKKDPRFGFSVMKASAFGIVGDYEDPHILYDERAKKWRMFTCENTGEGYKAILLESDSWNKSYQRIAGPVAYNSTGTSMQKINGKLYCFSGSSDRKIYIYTYPDLKEAGALKMDLPPWSENAGTRVWPNLVQLPEGYPSPFVALMMDRFNYPGLKGPNWTYGALYLYHGN